MRLCQYYAYVEIIDERERHIFGTTDNGTSLWQAYSAVNENWPNFQMTRIAEAADIYPVFRQLFTRQATARRIEDSPMNATASKPGLLFSGPDWDFGTLSHAFDVIERVAIEELNLDIHPVQMEIISSEQMLDAYSSIGMPLMYRHWSFGKHFLYEEQLYRKGGRGLAYEIVINSNPCIVYLMEENTMALQALVTAHAALGHNHFFKNNYLFKEWTDAGAILSYLDFAKNYIARCEERHGLAAVEEILDTAHALMEQGVFRYRRPAEAVVGEAAARPARAPRI